MTQTEFEDIKTVLRGFARLYFQHEELMFDHEDYPAVTKQLNRIANQIFATLPTIPNECLLLPAVGETYAFAFDIDWEARPNNERWLAIDVFRCCSLRSVCRPLELVG